MGLPCCSAQPFVTDWTFRDAVFLHTPLGRDVALCWSEESTSRRRFPSLSEVFLRRKVADLLESERGPLRTEHRGIKEPKPKHRYKRGSGKRSGDYSLQLRLDRMSPPRTSCKLSPLGHSPLRLASFHCFSFFTSVRFVQFSDSLSPVWFLCRTCSMSIMTDSCGYYGLCARSCALVTQHHPPTSSSGSVLVGRILR